MGFVLPIMKGSRSKASFVQVILFIAINHLETRESRRNSTPSNVENVLTGIRINIHIASKKGLQSSVRSLK